MRAPLHSFPLHRTERTYFISSIHPSFPYFGIHVYVYASRCSTNKLAYFYDRQKCTSRKIPIFYRFTINSVIPTKTCINIHFLLRGGGQGRSERAPHALPSSIPTNMCVSVVHVAVREPVVCCIVWPPMLCGYVYAERQSIAGTATASGRGWKVK